MKVPIQAAFLLFCLSVVYFIARGPWRAVHSVNSYDFASVYGAARAWLDGQNPYDMQIVIAQLRQAGDNPASFPNTDPPPSVYLLTALPVISAIAWLPWTSARLVWSCLSITLFIISLALTFTQAEVTASNKWLLAAGLFLFSPVSSGLSTGNPSVLSCSLTMLAVYLALRGREGFAALTLGLAHSMKPQISIAAVVLFTLWGYWRPLLLSFIFPSAMAVLSLLRASSIGQYRQWLAGLQQGLAAASVPGGINDPSPANYFSYHLVNTSALSALWLHNPALINAAVWLLAGTLVACYLTFQRNLGPHKHLRDMAFFSAISLTLVYHRYYDAQLLLMAIPFLLSSRGQKKAASLALWICMLAFVFPLQAVFAESLHGAISPATLIGVVLLRHQPVLLVGMCLLLIPWGAARVGMAEGHAQRTEIGI